MPVPLERLLPPLSPKRPPVAKPSGLTGRHSRHFCLPSMASNVPSPQLWSAVVGPAGLRFTLSSANVAPLRAGTWALPRTLSAKGHLLLPAAPCAARDLGRSQTQARLPPRLRPRPRGASRSGPRALFRFSGVEEWTPSVSNRVILRPPGLAARPERSLWLRSLSGGLLVVGLR